MSSAADVLRTFVYGNVPMDEWVAEGAEAAGGPWNDFVRAREFALQGQMDQAVEVWRQIAFSDGLESRQVLQAWHFLREAGEQPPPDRAKQVLGVIIEMPVPQGHDLLAAYKDGSARYLNFSGKAVVIEDRSLVRIQEAISLWIAAGEAIVQVIGPWQDSTFPSVPPGHVRVMMLTPSGPHFGQGPLEQLTADRAAGAFIGCASQLLQLVVNEAV
jgi:hypothetical protein